MDLISQVRKASSIFRGLKEIDVRQSSVYYFIIMTN